MRYMIIKRAIGLVVMLTIAGLPLASIPAANAADNNREPELPLPVCEAIQVPAGNRLASHAYAVGVQVYRWNGATWDFVEPVATLYADPDYNGKVGIHYVGPTWEHNGGSKVVATRVAGCSPDPTAISWLLLQTTSTDGPGIFSSVTFIQRVNTVGGLVPTAPGASIGATAQIPYTAEYYFYRQEN